MYKCVPHPEAVDTRGYFEDIGHIFFFEVSMVAKMSGMKRVAEWDGSSRPVKLRRQVSFVWRQ